MIDILWCNVISTLKGKVFDIQNLETDDNIFFTKYNKSYLERYDELFLLMYIYLQRHRSIEGYVSLTVKDFLLYYNYKPNRSKGRINDKIYNILRLMISQKFIQYIGCYSNGGLASLDGIDCDVMFTVQIISFDEKWNPQGDFVKVLYVEVDKLRHKNVKFMGKVLNLYLNVKKHITSDENNATAQMVAFPSEETLARECGFCVSSIKTYTGILCNIGMLYMNNYGSYLRMYKGQEIITNSNNVYALEEKYLNGDLVKEKLMNHLKNYYGFIDGFYPFCNNLPNKDILGEPDSMEKDYSMDEILDMPTIDEQYEFV